MRASRSPTPVWTRWCCCSQWRWRCSTSCHCCPSRCGAPSSSTLARSTASARSCAMRCVRSSRYRTRRQLPSRSTSTRCRQTLPTFNAASHDCRAHCASSTSSCRATPSSRRRWRRSRLRSTMHAASLSTRWLTSIESCYPRPPRPPRHLMLRSTRLSSRTRWPSCASLPLAGTAAKRYLPSATAGCYRSARARSRSRASSPSTDAPIASSKPACGVASPRKLPTFSRCSRRRSPRP